MKNNGWVKMHRKMTEWEWYTDDVVFRVFLHLLLTANHEEKKWHGISVKAGQKITGRKKLAEELNLGEQAIRTALTRLKSTNEITIESNTRYSLITILNWNKYQESTSDTTNSQPTTNQQLTTNKNVKKDKKENTSDVPSQELHLFISLFKEINPSYEQLYRNRTERAAAERLLKKFGLEKMEATAKKLPEIIKLPYAPRITTPYELERNLGKLLAFVEQKKNIIQDKKPKIAFI